MRADIAIAPRPPMSVGRTLGGIDLKLVLGGVLAFLATVLTWQWLEGDHEGVIIKLVVYGGWLFSLSLHEFSHSIVAYWGGDRGIKRRGYLTLNPLRFMHPLYSVIIPMFLVLIGGMGLIGGATMVDHGALRGRWQQSAVSLAGPTANLAVAVVNAAAFALGMLDIDSPFAAGLAFLGVLQVGAFVFNLIPCPPLDGFGALAPHLPPDIARRGDQLGGWGLLILIGIFMVVPGAGAAFRGIASDLTVALHLPADAIEGGYLGSRWF